MSPEKHTTSHSIQQRQDGSRQMTRFIMLTVTVFVVSMGLLFWAVKIYKRTLIDWRFLVAPVIIGAIFGIVISGKVLRRFDFPGWASLIIGTLIGSVGPLFSFLFCNERFADGRQMILPFKIERTGRLASERNGCDKPYAVINFFGRLEKEIVFDCEDADTINTFSQVSLTQSRGLFGYNVIRGKELIK